MASVHNIQLDAMKDKLENQMHILDCWDQLEPDQKASLLSQIKEIDFDSVSAAFEKTKQIGVSKLDDDLEPPPQDVFGSYKDLTDNYDLREEYRQTAFKSIHEGKFAILLLAGGQGTRLGVSYPKGMYDVNLPSKRSLYQLQAERLLGVCNLVKQKFKGDPFIPWYIMTSEHTKEQTEQFFRQHNYFGYNPLNIILFEQHTIPCLQFDGKIIMQSPAAIARSPNGNGGLYKTLKDSGMLYDMKKRGIEYLQTYCVDNILVKMADPIFLGFCISRDLDCAAKTVEKQVPSEPIGVIAKQNSQYKVVEYSEISEETARKLVGGGMYSENGSQGDKLMYHCGNICIHFMKVTFLDRVCQVDIETKLPYHVAKKKIPFYDSKAQEIISPTEPNGIKLEKFIFDVFPFSKNFGIWEVDKTEEFAPLKNPSTAKTDCPATCRQFQLQLYKKWATKAGAKMSEDTVVDISPVVSVDGEGLEFLNGATLDGVNQIVLAKNGAPEIVKITDWKNQD
ncbi:hypothetical protein Ciccas_010379 [Cichlidogyrus casuarinus]|uniref:UDP-N-acetylglucosamine diphosphorylase n=1 Tax=Cichlidogyrus casuarinus TaxID=1844966 RepID=A0ABD2PVX8_9PLAT